MSQSLDAELIELEQGFGDLLRSLRAVVRELQEENVVLRARLDELRHAAPVPTAAAIVQPTAAGSVTPMSSNWLVHNMVVRICHRCGQPFQRPKYTRRTMCEGCLQAAQEANLVKARSLRHATKTEAAEQATEKAGM